MNLIVIENDYKVTDSSQFLVVSQFFNSQHKKKSESNDHGKTQKPKPKKITELDENNAEDSEESDYDSDSFDSLSYKSKEEGDQKDKFILSQIASNMRKRNIDDIKISLREAEEKKKMEELEALQLQKLISDLKFLEGSNVKTVKMNENESEDDSITSFDSDLEDQINKDEEEKKPENRQTVINKNKSSKEPVVIENIEKKPEYNDDDIDLMTDDEDEKDDKDQKDDAKDTKNEEEQKDEPKDLKDEQIEEEKKPEKIEEPKEPENTKVEEPKVLEEIKEIKEPKDEKIEEEKHPKEENLPLEKPEKVEEDIPQNEKEPTEEDLLKEEEVVSLIKQNNEEIENLESMNNDLIQTMDKEINEFESINKEKMKEEELEKIIKRLSDLLYNKYKEDKKNISKILKKQKSIFKKKLKDLKKNLRSKFKKLSLKRKKCKNKSQLKLVRKQIEKNYEDRRNKIISNYKKKRKNRLNQLKKVKKDFEQFLKSKYKSSKKVKINVPKRSKSKRKKKMKSEFENTVLRNIKNFDVSIFIFNLEIVKEDIKFYANFLEMLEIMQKKSRLSKEEFEQRKAFIEEMNTENKKLDNNKVEYVVYGTQRKKFKDFKNLITANKHIYFYTFDPKMFK